MLAGYKAQSKKLMEQIIMNERTLKECERHSFDIDLNPERTVGKRWMCSKCKGTVDSVEKIWYKRGLEHGLNGGD